MIAKTGVPFEMKLPHPGFNRAIGVFASARVTPAGEIVSEEEWTRRRSEWLPNAEDGDFIGSLMKPVLEPGKFANWIAPPRVGIDNKPGDFEYVKLHMA
jgi:benzoyl-CoA 2,3-dioxygenase component B